MNICNSAGWTNTTDIERLREIVPVRMGARHTPTNHGEMLERFISRGSEQGIQLGETRGLLSPDQKRFMYVADVVSPLKEDYNFTIGFINFNDQSMAFTGLAGERVFVCSNLCITGMIRESRTRHSTFVQDRLDGKFDVVFDQFKKITTEQKVEIDRMKGTRLTDEHLGRFLLQAARKEFLGASNARKVVAEVDSPTLNNRDDNSLWRLHNAASFVIKESLKDPVYSAEVMKRVNTAIIQIAQAA